MNAVRARWDRLSRGQRLLVTIVAGAIAIAVMLVAWVESERTRARLDAELPRLRASIATLERDAAEVKRLRALPVAPAAARRHEPAPAIGKPGAGAQLATLATNSGGLQGAQISVLDERRVKVSGGDIAFGSLLEWLQNAQVTHGMRVESARLDALPAAGRVRAELLLTRS